MQIAPVGSGLASSVSLFFLRYFQNDGSGQQACICASQPLPANSSITSPDPQFGSACASSREKAKRRRRRRPEDRKNRGRKGAGGGRGLTPVYPAIRLPPLMSPALGLLPSAHGLLVRACCILTMKQQL